MNTKPNLMLRIGSSMVGLAIALSPLIGEPIITGLVEYNGDDSVNTPAQYTGQTFTHPNLGEITLGTFGEDAPAFRDRVHQWNGATADLPLPSYLVGGEYIMSRNDNRDNPTYVLEVTVSEPVFVYMLVDNRLFDGSASDPPHGGEPLINWSLMPWLYSLQFEPVLTGHNRLNDDTLPDEVGVDENANGSIENWSSVYRAQFTDTDFPIALYEMGEGGRNMYGVVITPLPTSVNNPPVIGNLAPANNTLFYEAASGIQFEATTVSPNRLEPDNIQLLLNGEDVSAALVIEGTTTARTIAYNNLQPNTAYRAEITVADQSGRTTTQLVVFDTWNDANAVVIEAEDYNYGGGDFVDPAIPGSYEGLTGAPDVDYDHDPGVTNLAGVYRTNDVVAITAAADGQRQSFVDAGATDYQIGNFDVGNWLNYTRAIPEGTYEIYLRASAGALPHPVELAIVQGDPSTAGQERFPIGTFTVARDPSGGTYHYLPLLDATGAPALLSLSGNETVRLTSLQSMAPRAARLNFLFLVPVLDAPEQPYVSRVVPGAGERDVPQDSRVEVYLANGSAEVAGGTVQLSFNGVDVTASATVTPASDGVTVSYDPGVLPLNAVQDVSVLYQSTTGVNYTNAWSFTTIAHPAIITSVVETGGDDSVNTPAQYSGQTFLHPNLGPYTVPRFDEDVPAFRDRVHQWNSALAELGLPSYLAGREYIMIRNDNRDNAEFRLDITVSEPAFIYVLVDNRLTDGSGANPPESGLPLDQWTAMTWMATEGFQPVLNGLNRAFNPAVPDEVGVDEGGDGVGPGAGINQYSSIYYRQVPAGTVSVYQPDNAGRNMYGVVVAAVSTHAYIPTVSISSPANNSAYPDAPAEITLTADAQVQDSSIASVEFYHSGETLIGTAMAAPFRLTWSHVSPGRYEVTARATAASGESAVSRPISVIVGDVLSINFQDGTAEVPVGYLADLGDVFGDRGNGYSYGWDLDNTTSARNRDSANSLDERYDTLTHMQLATGGAVWEIELPNGRYRVQAVAGDPTATDSLYDIQAEGVTVLLGTPTAGNNWITGSGVVEVTDGRLTLSNGPTASNNKIAFVDIATLPGAQPEAPVLTASRQGNQLVLNWTGESASYTVQGKDTLADAEWEDLITTSENTASIEIQGAAGFFRVLAQ
jgi:hypothetical protein